MSECAPAWLWRKVLCAPGPTRCCKRCLFDLTHDDGPLIGLIIASQTVAIKGLSKYRSPSCCVQRTRRSDPVAIGCWARIGYSVSLYRQEPTWYLPVREPEASGPRDDKSSRNATVSVKSRTSGVFARRWDHQDRVRRARCRGLRRRSASGGSRVDRQSSHTSRALSNVR